MPQPDQSDRLIGKAELRRRIPVSQPTLHRWEKQGTLVPRRINGRVYYLEAAVQALIDRGRGGKARAPIPKRRQHRAERAIEGAPPESDKTLADCAAAFQDPTLLERHERLKRAARALYAAGRWEARSVDFVSADRLWAELRDAAGIPVGSETARATASATFVDRDGIRGETIDGCCPEMLTEIHNKTIRPDGHGGWEVYDSWNRTIELSNVRHCPFCGAGMPSTAIDGTTPAAAAG